MTANQTLLVRQNAVENNDPLLANIEIEQALLGACLVDNAAFVHIGQLKAAHFCEPLHQRIFSAMHHEWHAGRRFDPLTMRAAFEKDAALIDIGGAVYLVKLAHAAPFAGKYADYARAIIELAQKRSLLSVCEMAAHTVLNSQDVSPTDLAMSLTGKLQESVTDFESSQFQDDFEVTEQILSDMKRDVQPYATGYSLLDTAMEGGLYPGKCYGFAARKKMGKTILAGSISHNLNQMGIRHLFVCGEMSPAEVQKRTLARQLRVNQSMFNSKQGKNSEFMGRVAKVALESKRAMIYKNAPGVTFEDLKNHILLARMQKKITGFILDYWQLVGGKKKGQSDASHLDEVAQWIADTCRKYDMWSITMAQINQEGNTRGGEGIRLAFDQVYILHAPENDPGRSERWLEMSDTRYTPWRSVGTQNRPAFYLNEKGPYFSGTPDEPEFLEL